MDEKATPSLKLKVAESTQRRELGRGRARIDQSSMKKLGVAPNDTIRIIGGNETGARAYPASRGDHGRELIMIDSYTRKNCATKLFDYVDVGRFKAKNAEYIRLTPIDIRIDVSNNFVNLVKDRLGDRVVKRGDTLLVMILGNSITFLVAEATPDEIVVMDSSTNLSIDAD
jgi:hypothetical protein